MAVIIQQPLKIGWTAIGAIEMIAMYLKQIQLIQKPRIYYFMNEIIIRALDFSSIFYLTARTHFSNYI